MILKRFKDLRDLIYNCLYTTPKQQVDSAHALLLTHSMLLNTKENQGIVYSIGNGGSAGIVSHFSIDLLNILKIPSHTLYDSSMMTCIANDYGYEHVFSNPLKTLANSKDLLIAMSSSGSSPNILNAVKVAKEKHMPVITFSGFESSNPLRHMGEVNYYLNQCDYGLVEMGHFFLMHTIIDSWKFHPKASIKKNELLAVGNTKQN